MKLESMPEEIKDTECFKNFLRFIAIVVCFAGLFSVVYLAHLKYGSCCNDFIWSIGALCCYTAIEGMIVLSQKEKTNRNNGYNQNEIKVKKNTRNHWVLTMCRFVFIIVLIVKLPDTGPCDGQSKEWTLVLLIVIASLFVITEGLNILLRMVMYCVRPRPVQETSAF
jgi:hypothetical protein